MGSQPVPRSHGGLSHGTSPTVVIPVAWAAKSEAAFRDRVGRCRAARRSAAPVIRVVTVGWRPCQAGAIGRAL
jgi:hypothetical protein